MEVRWSDILGILVWVIIGRSENADDGNEDGKLEDSSENIIVGCIDGILDTMDVGFCEGIKVSICVGDIDVNNEWVEFWEGLRENDGFWELEGIGEIKGNLDGVKLFTEKLEGWVLLAGGGLDIGAKDRLGANDTDGITEKSE